MLNLWGVLQVALLAWTCRALLESRSRSSTDGQAHSFYAYHTGFNIALFPVVFFFSALYYTDVYSTVFVLFCYQNHLSRLSSYDKPPLWKDLCTILVGVLALAMRQTNIFWVAIYMGGMEVVHAVKGLQPAKVEAPYTTTLLELVRFYGWRYSVGDIHDPPLLLSWPDGKRPPSRFGKRQADVGYKTGRYAF